MPSQALPDLDWSSITPLNGSKQDAFEELCTQLGRASCPVDTEFVRKGRPDSGVEAYAVHSDGTEWAWQAKYFGVMKSGQWSQLEKSVKTALEAHPNLVRYFVCVPLDLSDGRGEGTTTALEQWNARVKKWTKWATDRGMSVEFVWQGSHELFVELAKPQNVHLLGFFFGERSLNDDWFRARLQEAHLAAGPRYTPELNISVPGHASFDAFGRTPAFFETVRAKATRVGDRLRKQPFALVDAASASLQAALDSAQAGCDHVLEAFKLLSSDPVLPDPMGGLLAALLHARRGTVDVMAEYSSQIEAESAVTKVSKRRTDKQREDNYALSQLRELYQELQDALRHVEQYQPFVNGKFVVLTGDAGTGKTHLLCDLAKQRLDQGLPTVILMGQRYLDVSDPWTQTLQQLDIASWTASEFVGALEIIARRAGRRLLFVLDAINEGAGRKLWPDHLSAFLGRLRDSAWITTVISVRTSYAQDLLPDSVLKDALEVRHRGFEDLEFIATRAFFDHYGIDLPSTPLLAPEFSNPLYLKTLCLGLHASGERRLPRGFHGVVNAFAQYVNGVNKKAAKDLDYDPRKNLIDRALTSLAERMVQDQQPWVNYEEAAAIVGTHLPGRNHSQSLLAKLLGEGVLIEEQAWSEADDASCASVQIAYERLSDYRCVQVLLDRHLDAANPAPAFATGGALAPEVLTGTLGRPGFHEALHILVAERTRQELLDLVPMLAGEYFTADAFLKSLVWRDPNAVSPRSIARLLELRDSHPVEVIDTLVTLATIPGHPLNATFTGTLLRQTVMPDRDAWWTIGLHELWQQHNAIDRLLLWAEQVWPHVEVEDESAHLAARMLAWLLPSSNRFLRDQATKALVRVLTWRPQVVEQLVDQFSDVDDAYVSERVLAAAYGAAMRTTDASGLRAVADRVHARVFASGRPRPHLLLREYAQGIIKRAEFLGGAPDPVRWPNVDPPYKSEWPEVPTQSQVDAIVPDWKSSASNKVLWGHRRIRNSVMDDDFGRYVIGTNSWRTNWLSVRLDEPPWEPLDTRVNRAVKTLAGPERKLWSDFKRAASSVRMAEIGRDVAGFLGSGTRGSSGRSRVDADLALAQKRDALLAALDAQKKAVFIPLMDALSAGRHSQETPKFDLKLVQRYVVARVFELGWTSNRFEEFDSNLESRGREASKPERIGKKYQWIAYHEMLAFMADHYQYTAERGTAQIGGAYQGSWQESVRDIDPSNVILAHAEPDDEGSMSALHAFWATAQLPDWHPETAPEPWAQITVDVPRPVDLLFRRDEPSLSDWVVLATDLKWTAPKSAYETALAGGRREIWMSVDGALIDRADVSERKLQELARANTGGMLGGGLHEIFLGEIGWSVASKFFADPYYAHQGWAAESNPRLISGTPVAQRYARERNSLDGSVTAATISLNVPNDRMLELMQCRWSGISATYVDKDGTVAMFDPAPNTPGPSALLVRKERLQRLLQAHGLAVCWVIQGEKIDAQGSPHYSVNARRSFYGAFAWDGETLTGSYTFDKVELPGPDD